MINPRSALLSNFEVLSLLRELESEQLAETRAALAVKKEQAENGQPNLSTLPNQPLTPEVCENLRTVEFEVRAYDFVRWGYTRLCDRPSPIYLRHTSQ